MSSPYYLSDKSIWPSITHELVKSHPIPTEVIRDILVASWNSLWSSRIGGVSDGFSAADFDLPAPVVGSFFEKLFAKNIGDAFPNEWRGGTSMEKDIHCISNEGFSFEMKVSGQIGTKIFGNRSYAQPVTCLEGKKDKSGYYLTVNYFKRSLTLIRFGWIDYDDWVPQKSETGQMAGLKNDVYDFKLVTLKGNYMLNAPLIVIPGVGPSIFEDLKQNGFEDIGQIINCHDLPARFEKIAESARRYIYG